MTIDYRLAFGEYVSIPIRTEKTAEQKWDELRKYLVERRETLAQCRDSAVDNEDTSTALRYSVRRMELQYVVEKMEDLDI